MGITIVVKAKGRAVSASEVRFLVLQWMGMRAIHTSWDLVEAPQERRGVLRSCSQRSPEASFFQN